MVAFTSVSSSDYYSTFLWRHYGAVTYVLSKFVVEVDTADGYGDDINVVSILRICVPHSKPFGLNRSFNIHEILKCDTHAH